MSRDSADLKRAGLLTVIMATIAWGTFLPADAQAAAGFRKVILEEDCDNPMDLVVLPDRRVLFIERFGRVRLWKPELGQTVLAASIDVHGHFNPGTKGDPDQGSWEAGLLGMVLAPEFTSTGWVYLYYSPRGEPAINRLSRFTLTGDTLDLASETPILDVPVQREVCCHEAGSLAFDGEGNLFLSTGDNTNPFASDGFSPTDFRDDRFAYDAARSAGNANDLRGKILRIHPEPDGSYTIPAGNLFPPGTPHTKPEIFVMGCRNPFRIAVDRTTGVLSWGEVGPDAREFQPHRGPAGFDEFNCTREAGNFGWPFLIADNKPYHQFDFATAASGPTQDPARPLNVSPRNTGPARLPPAQPAWIWYPYAPSVRFPIVGSGGRTACAGPTYHYQANLDSPGKLPAYYDGCQFLFEWERGWILAARTASDGSPLLELFAPEISLTRPIDLNLGPDGCLYAIEFGTGWENNSDAQVVRIEFTSAPQATANSLGPAPTDQAILAYYQDCLEGGDVTAGRRLFFEKTSASCHRCHRASDAGPAGEIGPDLRDIGQQRTRRELLESLILPNKTITKGFETTLVVMSDGRQHAGVVKDETTKSLRLVDPETGPVVLMKSEIDERVTGLSPMPADIRKVFSKDEVRHVVAFLASLRQTTPTTKP